MTIKSFQGLGLVNHNIPPPPQKKKKKNCKLQKNFEERTYYIILQGRQRNTDRSNC